MSKAAECLALCVGNPQIRQALLEVEQHVMFVWLLRSKDYDVRTHGALALSKFAVVNKVAEISDSAEISKRCGYLFQFSNGDKDMMMSSPKSIFTKSVTDISIY